MLAGPMVWIDTLRIMARAAPPSRRSLVLRPMAVRDVAAVGGIDARAFGPGCWPESAFLAELRENRLARYFVIAEPPEGVLLGYIGCWVLADALHIVTLGVDPAQQRQGIGDLLVMRALDLAREAGVPEVALECRASNDAALVLYRKYGFQVTGRRPRYYADKEDAVIMTVGGVRAPAFGARLEAQRATHATRRDIALTRIGG